MLLKNKKAVELSINFIVMLILAISVFTGGLVFAAKFFKQAETMKGSLDSQTERQIERLLDSGAPVVIPVSTKEIFRKKFDTFALGIFALEEGHYKFEINTRNAYDKNKQPITGIDFGEWVVAPETEKDLKKNENAKFLIGVEVPSSAKSGLYIYEIKVTLTATDLTSPLNGQYDDPVQIIVRVP